MPNENEKKVPRFLSESVLISIIPIYAYILLFLFETKFCFFFNISSSLIEINLLNFLKYLGIVAPAVLLTYFTINSIRLSASVLEMRAIFCIAYFLVILQLAFVNEWFKWPELLFILSLFLFLIFIHFIQPLFTGKGKKGLKAKIEYDADLNRKKNSFTNIIINKYGYSFFATIYLMFIFCFIFYIHGGIEAKTRTSFLVLKKNPELVVLRIYGNKYLCYDFDRQNKELKDKFYLITLEQIAGQEIQIQNENIGPLKVPKKK